MTGAESIPVLQAAAEQLADDVSEDYWEATEGNAKRAILQLVALAKMRPDGVWDGDRQQRVRAVAGSHEPGGR